MPDRKSLFASARRHARQSWKVTAIVCVAGLVPLVGAVVLAAATGTSLSAYTRDQLTVVAPEAPFYMGFVSNLGAMIWAAGAVVALFGGYGTHAGSRKGRFLVVAGWFSLLLAADDMFMLHDVLHEPLGVDASYVYGAIGLYGVWRYRDILLEQTNFVIFALAFGGLGMSAGMDGVTHTLGLDHLPGTSFVEDALKFMGICFWMAFAWREAARAPAMLPLPAKLPASGAPVQAKPAAPTRKTPAPL